MPVSGDLYGPYAHQFVGERLKFWFAIHDDDSQNVLRYECLVLPDGSMQARRRPMFDGAVPTHQAQFLDYLPPNDLSHLRREYYPRFPRDRFIDAILPLLSDEQASVFLAYRLTGKPPAKFK